LATVKSTTDHLERVQRALDRLTAEVRSLRRTATRDDRDALRRALRRRGLVLKNELHEGGVLPRAVVAQAEFYLLLRHYSFRLFLRDVIKHREAFTLADLVRYCSPATARRYLEWLLQHRIVRRSGRAFRLACEARSFGPTLEWFVAAVLEREYGIPCAWNVRLDAARGGGDYDVIGFQEGACVYIETKSSPPRNIECRQVRAFFDRLDTLRPQLAIFLNDTQLRMGDKIAVLFAEELQRRLGRAARQFPLRRLSGELFVIGDRLLIANSDPDLVGNLGMCLAQYFRPPAFQLNSRR
jgi:hypothetical protein